MTIPRLIVLTGYPLLFLASLLAAIQTRRLAKALPSDAWTEKRRNMVFFCVAQVFGLAQNVWFQRQASWLGAIYFTCTLIFVIRLNWFDYLLLQTYKRLRVHASKMPDPETAGEKSIEYWEQSQYAQTVRAIDDRINPDFLKPYSD